MNHLHWDGYPLLLEHMERLTQVCTGAHSSSNTSVQLVPNVFKWVETDLETWTAGENLDEVVGREVQYPTMVNAQNKTTKKYAFLFLNSINHSHTLSVLHTGSPESA